MSFRYDTFPNFFYYKFLFLKNEEEEEEKENRPPLKKLCLHHVGGAVTTRRQQKKQEEEEQQQQQQQQQSTRRIESDLLTPTEDPILPLFPTDLVEDHDVPQSPNWDYIPQVEMHSEPWSENTVHDALLPLYADQDEQQGPTVGLPSPPSPPLPRLATPTEDPLLPLFPVESEEEEDYIPSEDEIQKLLADAPPEPAMHSPPRAPPTPPPLIEDNEEFRVKQADSNTFVLHVKSTKSFKHSNAVNEITYTVGLRHPSDQIPLSSLFPELLGMFETLLDEMMERYGPGSMMRIFMTHPRLESAIIIYPDYLGKMNVGEIMAEIERHIKSAGHIPADENLSINVAICSLLSGRGWLKFVDQHDAKKKKSMIKIENTDHRCLARAIVVALARWQWDSKRDDETYKFYDRIRKGNGPLQEKEAKALIEKAGVPRDREGWLKDVPLYEKSVEMNIVVVSTRAGNKNVYNGCGRFDKTLYLYHSETLENPPRGHFDVITKMPGFTSQGFYCEYCQKSFTKKTKHCCKNYCNLCGRKNCNFTENVAEVECRECNRVCRSLDCWNAHQRPPIGRGKNQNKALRSICQQFYKCKECGLVMERQKKHNVEEHICGETYCGVCCKYYMGERHQCFIRSMDKSEKEITKFIFFDFECTQDEGIHEPNLVVAETLCAHCEEQEEEDYVFPDKGKCAYCGYRCNVCGVWNKKEKQFERPLCPPCGNRQQVFKGTGNVTLHTFCQWLIHERNRNATVIAHNAKGYDSYFIFQYLMAIGQIPEPIIFSGTKIMHMKMKALNMSFLDSFNFLPMALARLPSSFGLNELRKGYFPHLINTKENQELVLTHGLPETKYYSPDTMGKKARENFLQWHAENAHRPFDLQKDMLEYCISDVDILKKACFKFRNLVRQVTGHCSREFDPTTGVETRKWENAVDPFNSMTIASVCMAIFRAKFLPENWSVLLRENAQSQCNHGKMCQCAWTRARKLKSTDDLQIWQEKENTWVPERFFGGGGNNNNNNTIVARKFESTPLAQLPNYNILGVDIYSDMALEWLQMEEKTRGWTLQTARSLKGEKIVPVYNAQKKRLVHLKLDGFCIHQKVLYAFEFYGCSYHGCPRCYQINRETSFLHGKSFAQRWRETEYREKLLKAKGFQLITIWACEYVRRKMENPDLVRGLKPIEPALNLKDCYFGGRTNALVLHKKFDGTEKGYYLDFTSLYPAVLKYKRFPVGHPDARIWRDFAPLKRRERCTEECQCGMIHWQLPYFGIIKVTLLPPRHELIPVLPVRINNKLKFPLCYTCAAEENSAEPCEHTEEERSFTQTYCTPEVEVAINTGYKILKIHEVLHWSNTEKYDEEKKTGGLFTQYINTFLKLKQEASGFPENVKTEEEKRRYVEDYFDHEGIWLNATEIQKNPGLRSLSKLALNSFYGKFGQRANLGKSVFVKDLGTLYNLMTDASKKVTNWHIMTEDILLLDYTQKENFNVLENNFSGNVVIAAFCTAWARLKLWGEMKKLGSRVLYHDTDSIIFSADLTHYPEQYMPPTGSYLGQFTDELTCKEVECPLHPKDCRGHWITEFVSCGPKNYAYTLNTGQVSCKVRGFSLNYQNSQVLNFESMKRALFSWHRDEPEEFVTVSTMILRDKHDPKVYNRRVSKRYGVVYDKRKVLPDLTTVPFGYI